MLCLGFYNLVLCSVSDVYVFKNKRPPCSLRGGRAGSLLLQGSQRAKQVLSLKKRSSCFVFFRKSPKKPQPETTLRKNIGRNLKTQN